MGPMRREPWRIPQKQAPVSFHGRILRFHVVALVVLQAIRVAILDACQSGMRPEALTRKSPVFTGSSWSRNSVRIRFRSLTKQSIIQCLPTPISVKTSDSGAAPETPLYYGRMGSTSEKADNVLNKMKAGFLL